MMEHGKFRSVLPHEPLPMGEECGYLHVQGAFEPKQKAPFHPSSLEQPAGEYEQEQAQHSFWNAASLEQALLDGIVNKQKSNRTIQDHNTIRSLQLLDASPPFTKVRLVLASPQEARHVLATWRQVKITPSDLLQHSNDSQSDDADSSFLQFSTRPLQVTQITTCPLPKISWSRSNPPKFRRLLARAGENTAALEAERATTRFAFITGLIDKTMPVPLFWEDDSYRLGEAIRQVLNAFDTSTLGVEVFVPNKTPVDYCHVGMRSSNDLKRLIKALQGQQVEWTFRIPANKDDNTTTVEPTVKSGKLFLDYADVTQRSYARDPHKDGTKGVKGEPSRSECTSSTDSVVVPGLALIPEFVSREEEEVLMAVLTGPHAPWAPSQSTPSKNGIVKRRVQHYGYVFDYETADVLRDRSSTCGNCPPVPALAQEAIGNLEEHISQSVQEGRGWETFAGVIERTRRHDFSTAPGGPTSATDMPIQSFPTLNQITVNEYQAGNGIGTHVDTPTAFGDGLISISLNAGIVMEFRHTRDEQGDSRCEESPLRKLIYLPPRSLLLMSGPARYEWEHMIVSRMTDTHNGKVLPRGTRVSLTLRTALELPAKGGGAMELVQSFVFPPRWGSQDGGGMPCAATGKGELQNAWVTPLAEKNHVHAVYDAIATQWHHTRGKRGVLWPGATQFLTQLPPGSVVADVGCGDGKYFPAIWATGSYVIGTDISRPLLQTSIGASAGDEAPENRKVSEHRRHFRDRPAVVVADCMSIPLRSRSCDAAICIAVMHHLSTEERRLRCIQELARIVKVGGTINIQAWAMEQDQGSRRKFAATDVFVPFNAQPKYLDKMQADATAIESGGASKSVAQMYSETYNGAEFDEGKGLVVFKRYCHLYRKGELDELATRVSGIMLTESGYESGNHFIILKVADPLLSGS